MTTSIRLLCAIALLLAACGEQKEPQSGSVSFASLDDFVAADPPSPGRVVFIGIDGAAWWYVDSLIAAGELPNLERLKREGSYGDLRSVECFVSPPAWATLFTGMLPENTGVYTFAKWDKSKQTFQSVSSSDVRTPALWDLGTYAGKKVGVVNVPMTYPVRPVNGLMVSGLMTPIDSDRTARLKHMPIDQAPKFTDDPRLTNYSPQLRSAMKNGLNRFLCSFYDTVDDGRRQYDTVSMTVVSRIGSGVRRSEPVRFATGVFSPWLRIRAHRENEIEDGWCKLQFTVSEENRISLSVSPTFFRINADYIFPPEIEQTLHSTFEYYLPTKFQAKHLVGAMTDDAAAALTFLYGDGDWDFFAYVFTQSDNIHHTVGFTEQATDVYRRIDAAIGQIVRRMPPDARLVIASDHGFKRFTYGVDLNRQFERMGLLEWAGEKKIDHARTLVFHNLWHVYFNDSLITRAALASRGITVPDGTDPVDYFADFLTREVNVAAIGDMGPVHIELRRLPADPAGMAPDMFVRPDYGDYSLDFWGLREAQSAPLRVLDGGHRFNHQREGIYLAWGKGIRRGAAGTRDIQDIAPTMCFLLGLPIAEAMDGVLMKDIFEIELLSSTPRFEVSSYSEIILELSAEGPEAESTEAVEKKLRSLGYVR